MAADITGRPTIKVKNLGAPTRQSGNRKMKATWKVPNDMIKDSKKDRATELETVWTLKIPGKDPKMVKEIKRESTTESTINLDNLKIGGTTYTRSSFYPIHSSRKLQGVSFSIRGHNKKGDGPKESSSMSFVAPDPPSISGFSFDNETGTVSATINTGAGAGAKEKYDTRYWVRIKQSWNGADQNIIDTSSTATSIPVSYNPGGYQALGNNDYIEVTVNAYARGYAGNSRTVTATFYIAFPAQATIDPPTVTGKTGADRCTIPVRTNHTTQHPVDRVKLEYLANCTYASAADIPAEASWTDSGIIDDSNCTAMSVSVADLMPERGKHTWVRVKTYHANEAVLKRYSNYQEVKALFVPVPTAADDDIVILSANAGADGKSAVVRLGWNADGQDDSTGTELSWADEEDAWKSTRAPSEHNFAWSDGPVTEGGVTYQDSATITIKDLTEGETYYIRARRYLEDEVTTYSPYSNTATVVTSEKPEAVVATAASYLPAGKSLPVYWTLSGNGLQTEWRIVEKIEDDGTYIDGAIIAEGKGSLGATQIDAARLASFATDGKVTFAVQASTGSGLVSSDIHTVSIVEPPELSISAGATLTAQPFSFAATSNSLADLVVVVTSHGSSGQFPDGAKRQTYGDTVYSDVISPLWAASGDDWTTTITLPGGLEFWDLAEYTLSVMAVDNTTGLRSEAEEATFNIGWSHQAVHPEEYVMLTPINTVDEEGYHRMAVEIDLTPPEDAAETDLYDIYRLTGDGPVLIGEGFPLTHTTTDEYAPFGDDLAYRIAIKTIDGDSEFADIEYEASCDNIRFDWAGGFLEVPYNLSVGDTYKKDFEIREHMDGSNDGFWNPNISRTAKLSTDVVKLTQSEDIERARQLARYAGPVFVRTPEGSAYEADVQVTDLSADNKAIMKVSFDATEIGLTREFSLPIPYELEEEESE